MATSPPKPPPFNAADLDFKALSSIADLVCGAVIGYAFILFAEILDPVFREGKDISAIQLGPLALVAFVLIYLLSDSVEARLLTHRFAYIGRGRFSVDLFVCLAFFLAFGSAAHASPNFLIPFASAFFLGAIWAVYLHRDTKNTVTWQYPKAVVLSHFAAGVLWTGYWLELHNAHIDRLHRHEILVLFGFYIAWLALSTAVKEIARIPSPEADLFPTSLVDICMRKTIAFFRS